MKNHLNLIQISDVAKQFYENVFKNTPEEWIIEVSVYEKDNVETLIQFFFNKEWLR